MAVATYTVKKGDTLSEIAYKYYKTYGYNTWQNYMNALASINNIPDVNRIYVGQKLKMTGAASTKPSSSSGSVTVTILQFGARSDDDTTLFVSWKHSKDNTDKYQVLWEYYDSDAKQWRKGEDTTTTDKVSDYKYPSIAQKVRVKIKPISKKYTKNNKEYSYYTGKWSDVSKATYDVYEQDPLDIPTQFDTQLTSYLTYPKGTGAKITAYCLKVSMNDYPDDRANRICFALESWDENRKPQKIHYEYGNLGGGFNGVNRGSCSTTFYGLKTGYTYKVKCRAEIGNINIDKSAKIEEVQIGTDPNGNPLYAAYSTYEYTYTTAQYVKKASEWSHYSEEFTVASGTPSGFMVDRTVETQDNTFDVYLKWDMVHNASTYNIEYTEILDHFDSGSGTTVEADKKNNESCLIAGLTGGKTYYFRLQSQNEIGTSGWTTPISLVLGVKPSAPTTWSSVTSAVIGEDVTLYWLHNSEDSSEQKHVQIGLTVDNGNETIIQSSTGDKEKPINYYVLKTDEVDEETGLPLYADGASIKWRVRTAGVMVENVDQPKYSDWSMTRSISVYNTPEVQTYVTDQNGYDISEITAFPFKVYVATNSESNQTPVTYHLSIVSNETYETVDGSGNAKTVRAGDKAFSINVDAASLEDKNNLEYEFDAGNIDLENGVSYSVVCSVTMDSGLSGSSSTEIYVSWEELYFQPDAQIVLDTDIYAAHIRPYSGRIPYYTVENGPNGYLKTETIIAPCEGDAVVKETYSEFIEFDIDALNELKIHAIDGLVYEHSIDSYGIHFNINSEQNPNLTDDMNRLISIEIPTGYYRFQYASTNEMLSIDDDDPLYFNESNPKPTTHSGAISNYIYLNKAGYANIQSLGNYISVRTEVVCTTTGEIVYQADDGSLFCIGSEIILDDGVLLSIYRRNFDGTFTEIARDLENTGTAYITDPHPALDFARYRIVAKTIATGSISYTDITDVPVGGTGAVIQWEEDWSEYDIDDLYNERVEESWTGSMVKLPYNVDISSSYDKDVALVNYIGRQHPVSYYGTHLGEKISCSTDIPANDLATLKTLRMLATYTGDVYFRESSGIGYWANVSVSFSQTHCEVTIPVTIEVTRVEGGV